jgi:ketosteroid isomerase-like protein
MTIRTVWGLPTASRVAARRLQSVGRTMEVPRSSTQESAMSETITAHAAVDRFLVAVESAAIPRCDAWCDEATLDATVPDWRFRVRGADAIRTEYSKWFDEPGAFEQVRRLTTDEGEVVEFTLTWTEDGVPHASHHAHILTIRDGRIFADTVLCGGRWRVWLLAEMEASDA